MRPLLHHPEKAPRRKLRGRRRYFQGVQRKADSFVLEPESSWDFWHYHADWKGWGNLGWKHRAPHVRALCTVFRKICEARDQFSTPFQAWIVLNGEDAGLDATYLHSPNPRDTFPLMLPDAEWGASAALPLVQAFLPDLPLEAGWTHVLGEDDDGRPAWRTSHWFYAPGIGEPLRAL